MSEQQIADQIREAFDEMTPQMQMAARFVVDNPKEVALLSMREQARRAGVTPITMMRLAKHLGFSGYDELRSMYANAVRDDAIGFSARAVKLLERRDAIGDLGLISEMTDHLSKRVAALSKPDVSAALIEAAQRLSGAASIYCLGLRSCYPIAFQIAYVQSYLGSRAALLDGPGATGFDALYTAPSGSVLLVVSVNPYAQASVDVANMAAKQGIDIIAITDSQLSPIARLATITILVDTSSPSFFDSMTPAFAVGEILVALLATREGPNATSSIRDAETRLTTSGVFWSARRKREK
jgi:DNA-binding MurR/RpiR family transcriptional regulator